MKTNLLKNNWRSATIFISSTFVDMNEERDVLNSYVIPKLNEHFYSRRINVQLVDLRWGVRTAEIEDEVVRDNKVLSVCFDEIDRSQPFFVAILGDRYGYDSLDKNIIDSIAYKFNGISLNDSSDLHNKSVTELEILYGVLLHPEKQLSNSFFCMRHADYSGVPKEIKEEYTLGKSKMDSLRGKIIDSCDKFGCSQNIIDYHVSEWDDEMKRFESFDKVHFGELLFTKLIVSISEYFDTMDEEHFSFPEQLLYEQETFLEDIDSAKGMERRIERLLDCSSKIIIVQGESGIGKTTICKHLAKHLISRFDNTKHILYFNAGLSARCRDIKNILICWIWQVKKSLGEDINDIEKLKVDELNDAFELLLQKGIKQGHEFWFVLDSYELIYKNAFSESLPFLKFAKEVYIATQTDTKMQFHKDVACQTMVLPGLDLNEAKEMMMELFEKHHKEWYSNLWDIIQNKFESSINPLWIELAVDILSSLTSRDYLNIKSLQSSTNNGGEAQEKYLISLIKDFPANVPQMFGYLYNKVLDEDGWPIQEEFYLGYISLSRNGIRESDLAALTKQTNSWDPLLFANIRYRFHSCIKEKGEDNCWGFSHTIYNHVMESYIQETGKRMSADYINLAKTVLDDHLNAFLKSYVKEDDKGVYVDYLEMLHGSLGHHYVHCDRHYDLRISECVYHLIRGNDKESTAIFLLNSDAQDDIKEEYSNAIREIADYIIDNNDVDLSYFQVPKGMPIPEIGYMSNGAIGWLMDLFHVNLPIDNWNLGRLMKIFALEVSNHLQERGEMMSCYHLNLRLLAEINQLKGIVPEEERFGLDMLIKSNFITTQRLLGHSYDLFSHHEGTSEKNIAISNDDSDDANLSEMYLINTLMEQINHIQEEKFYGNHVKVISQCNEILNNIGKYSGKIPENIIKEGMDKCHMSMADSYLALGQWQRALDIYKTLNKSVKIGSSSWSLLQERLFQIYFGQRDPLCLTVAENYFSNAKKEYSANKTLYENNENLAQAYILFLRAMGVVHKGNREIEAILAQAELFFEHLLHEYEHNTQLLRSYSYLQEFEGEFYNGINQPEKAELSLKHRLEICEFLSGIEPLSFNASRDYAKSNEDLGHFYFSHHDYLKAHDYFNDVVQIISKWNDSEEKDSRLASVYLADGEILMNVDERDLTGIVGVRKNKVRNKAQLIAEIDYLFTEALKIYRHLAINAPQDYEPCKVMMLNKLAIFYSDNQRFSESEELYTEAIDILRHLDDNDPSSFTSQLAGSIGGLAYLKNLTGNFLKAEELAVEGLKIDQNQLFIYTNLAAALLFQGKYDKAWAIYKRYKEELQEMFLDDLIQYEKLGIIPVEHMNEVGKIKKMLSSNEI